MSFFAFLVSFIVNVLIIYLSHKYNLFIDKKDKPQAFHTDKTPRAGGIGIFLGILFMGFTNMGIKLLIPSFLAFLSGIFEDFYHSLSPKLRLFLQTIAAMSAAYFSNAVATYFGLGIEFPYVVGFVVSVFAIVTMMNAVNMIDGFNGLAGGSVLMILGAFYYVSYMLGLNELHIIITVVICAVFGFFVLNFPKGKIFLGDGGAYLLGFLVAVFGIYLAGNYERVSFWYVVAVMIYPLWEVVFSVIRKISWGQSPLKPDKYHFHMLIYRHITKNNPLTGLFINLFYAPFILIATMHFNQSITNITISVIFILCYTFLYMFLLNREKRD
ncbi:glycosyltransferase family 4 protein [Caminibacter sp.]